MQKRFGWIFALVASLTAVCGFANDSREEEQTQDQQEEVAAMELQVQDETCADTEE